MVERKQGRRSAQQAEETKQHILLFATQMFCEQGYERVSLRSISEKAGVSHSLIRHHFGSKEKIWHAISDGLHDYMQRYIGHILEKMPCDTAPNVKLYRLVSRLLAFMLTYPQPIQLIADAVRQEDALFDYFIDNVGELESQVFAIAEEYNTLYTETPVNVAEMKWQMIMVAHSAASLTPFMRQTWVDESLNDVECLARQWQMFEKHVASTLHIEQKNRLTTVTVDDLVYDVPCFTQEQGGDCAFEKQLNQLNRVFSCMNSAKPESE